MKNDPGLFYSRKIDQKLLALRLTFIALFPASILCFRNGYDKPGYFIGVVLIFASLLVVQNIRIYSERFEITKFYFFGFIRWKWKYKKDQNIDISSHQLSGSSQLEIPHDPMNTGVGCLIGILAIFFEPQPGLENIKVRQLKEDGSFFNSVDIRLKRDEVNLLQPFIVD